MRLNSVISQLSLASINLEKSSFSVDFKADEKSFEDGETCVKDFYIDFKISGGEVVFSFEQWLEVESTKLEEDWGVGTFTISDMTF